MDHARVEGLPPAKGQQLAGQLGAALNAGQRMLDALFGPGIARKLALQQMQVAANDL